MRLLGSFHFIYRISARGNVQQLSQSAVNFVPGSILPSIGQDLRRITDRAFCFSKDNLHALQYPFMSFIFFSIRVSPFPSYSTFLLHSLAAHRIPLLLFSSPLLHFNFILLIELYLSPTRYYLHGCPICIAWYLPIYNLKSSSIYNSNSSAASSAGFVSLSARRSVLEHTWIRSIDHFAFSHVSAYYLLTGSTLWLFRVTSYDAIIPPTFLSVRVCRFHDLSSVIVALPIWIFI